MKIQLHSRLTADTNHLEVHQKLLEEPTFQSVHSVCEQFQDVEVAACKNFNILCNKTEGFSKMLPSISLNYKVSSSTR